MVLNFESAKDKCQISNDPCYTQTKVSERRATKVVYLNCKYYVITYMVPRKKKKEYGVERMWNSCVL